MNSCPTFSNDRNSLIIQSEFLATYHRPQLRSLPGSIIYYITKNPSASECYEKLIQTCKYFFIKNPILVLSSCSNIDQNENGWFLSCNKKSVNLGKITLKIWIDVQCTIRHVYSTNENFPSSFIIPKIYQNDVKWLIINSVNISLDEIVFLVSPKCEDVRFSYIAAMDENGSIVTLEKLVEALPNVKNFFYAHNRNIANVITSRTMVELLKIPHFSNLDYCSFYYIPEVFDIETFYSYMERNKKTNFHLYFDVISEQYEGRLCEIINELLDAKNRDYMAPFIEYYDIDPNLYACLERLCFRKCK